MLARRYWGTGTGIERDRSADRKKVRVVGLGRFFLWICMNAETGVRKGVRAV